MMSELFRNYGQSVAAIEESGKIITYNELFEFSDEMKSVIGRRTLVFALCSNCIGSLAGYVAFMNCDIVPLLLSEKLDGQLLEELLDSYHPEYLWVSEQKSEKFPAYVRVYEKYGYVLLKTNMDAYPMYEELALLLTTSGSTGSPKLVRQSYQNIISNTKSIVQYLELDETERPITTLPMNYTYGLSIINTHLYVGATLLLTEKTLMQKEFWSFFEEQNATSFGGVPYIYEMLDKLRFFRMKLPSLRYTTQAGGKLSPELHKKFAEHAKENNQKFIVMYGQTEATARMAYLPAENSLKKYGSMGIAIPGGRFELVDVNGDVIQSPETVGELVYYGENVTLGYAQTGKDLRLGDERNGKLITGDMAKMDVDGYYYIVGRKKRFLKIFGNRVNLDETERLIKGAFDGIECACGGQDDKMKIYIVKDSCSQHDMEEIKKFIALKTGLNSSAFRIVMITNVPKNDAGKVLYSELENVICE